jgi:hypothetical protein
MTNITNDLVPNTTSARQALYQTERYGAASYSFPVPPGDYLVKLHFAEIFFKTPGYRVFGVNVQGTPAVTGLDIYQSVGASPLVIPVKRTVTTGALNWCLPSITRSCPPWRC